MYTVSHKIIIICIGLKLNQTYLTEVGAVEVNHTDVAHTCMTIRSNHVIFNNKLKLPFKLQPNKSNLY